VSQLPKGAELARVRTAEAQCASAALGLAAPRMLEFGDGQLADYARGPDAEGRDLQASLATAIAAERPDLVITWGPDGGYGHADHRLVGVMVTQAIQALPAQTRPRLVYSAISTASKPLPPHLETWGMTAPDLLDLAIAFEPRDLAAASQATQCHKTQFDAASLPQISPLFEQVVWRGAVRFRSAFPAARARRR
jgi:LmbE family N-acetylglucosaminyl deacetylase